MGAHRQMTSRRLWIVRRCRQRDGGERAVGSSIAAGTAGEGGGGAKLDNSRNQTWLVLPCADLILQGHLVSLGWAVCTSSMSTRPAVLAFLSAAGSTKYQMRPPPGTLYW